jgi:hypothetical protein
MRLCSLLCHPESWEQLSVDDMAQLYSDELTEILDRLIPERTTTYRHRSSDPLFDDDCRVAKRTVRLFERDARRACRVLKDLTILWLLLLLLNGMPGDASIKPC